MYSDTLIVQVHKLLKMAFECAELDATKASYSTLGRSVMKVTTFEFDERNIKKMMNCFESAESFESNKCVTKEIIAAYVLLKSKKISKIEYEQSGEKARPKPIYWQQFKKLYCIPDAPTVPNQLTNSSQLEQKPVANYLLGTWWEIYNRSPITRDIHLHLMHIYRNNADISTTAISYLASDGGTVEECAGFAYTDESGYFTIIDQVAGEQKRRQIHIKIKHKNSRLSQLMWGQVNLISDSDITNIISYVNVFKYIGSEKPANLQPKRYKYKSKEYEELSEGFKWYFLSAQRSYLKLPTDSFNDMIEFEALAKEWEKKDWGESYEEVFQEMAPIQIQAYFQNSVWKLYTKSISGNIHEHIFRIEDEKTKIGKLTRVTLKSASDEYESYKGYCYVSNDNYIIANLSTVPSNHKACHFKIKCGKGVQPIAMIGQANYLMSMNDYICTDNIVLEKTGENAKPQRHEREDYSKLPLAVKEYFQLNRPFRLLSFDVIANLSELRKCVRNEIKSESPIDGILNSYYKNYWVYYQQQDKKKEWKTYEWELKFISTNCHFVFSNLSNLQDTDLFLSQQIYRSPKNMITLAFKNEYEGLTIEFMVTGVFKSTMECFTGTLTGVRNNSLKHATVSILMVLKSVKDFKRIDDERIYKFFAQQTVKYLEPQKLEDSCLDDI